MKTSVWALKHPVPVAVIAAGAVMAGILALFSLNREFIPEITEPSALVVTIWPSVAAEEVDRHLTSVLEDYFTTLSGLEDMRSESREGVSIIRLQFDETLDIDLMIQEVRTQIDRSSRELPQGIMGKPVVSKAGSQGLPVVAFAVSGLMESDDLYAFVDGKVIPEIFKADGVAQVNVFGDRRKVLEIRLDTRALERGGITSLEVLGALRRRDVSLPTGLVEWEGNDWAFRVSGEFTQLSEIEELVVASPGGVPVSLADVAAIEEVYADVDERVRSAGQDLLVIQVTKRTEGNTIQMSRDIRQRLSGFDELDFVVLHDDADIVRSSLTMVSLSALAGLVMAMAVIWFFLRDWQYTAVIAVSLPISLVITFACMRLAGLSINALTMAGITVSLGMIVDAAIVVLESIHRRRDAGADPDTAALTGVARVSGAVTAFVITSICVFLPILFLKGIIGSVLKDLSLTLIFMLSASLFTALIIVPPLARQSLLNTPPRRFTAAKIEDHYRRGLKKSIKLSWLVILFALALLAASFYAANLMGISFIPAADYNELFVSMELAPGSSLDESTQIADKAEAVIRKEIPAVSDIVFYVGMNDDLSGDARTREALWGHILLRESRDRQQSFRHIIHRLNEILPPALPGVSIQVLNGGFDRLVFLGTNGPGYRVELSSESLDDLRLAADQVEAFLGADPEIVSTGKDHEQDRLFVVARLDSDVLNYLGVDATDAALTARIAFGGTDVGNFQPRSGRERRLVLSSDLKNRQPDTEATSRLWVRNRQGQLVSFDGISQVNEEEGVSSIFRHNRKRTVTVIGYSESENIRGIGRRLRKK